MKHWSEMGNQATFREANVSLLPGGCSWRMMGNPDGKSATPAAEPTPGVGE